MTPESRESTIRRLRRIEGQVRGLIGMIESERYCIDILQQVHAVQAALTKTESEILRGHAATCVEEALDSGDADEQRRKFSELVKLFEGVRR
jgi:CsoR family transcriptional regulator, copper-sensing transcriptional repressor